MLQRCLASTGSACTGTPTFETLLTSAAARTRCSQQLRVTAQCGDRDCAVCTATLASAAAAGDCQCSVLPVPVRRVAGAA